MGSVVLLQSECLSTAPYRAVTLCVAGGYAGVTESDFLCSTGEIRGSKLGSVTIIFTRMSGGFIKLPVTGSYRYKYTKEYTKLTYRVFLLSCS